MHKMLLGRFYGRGDGDGAVTRRGYRMCKNGKMLKFYRKYSTSKTCGPAAWALL